ncbi:MAG: sensor histidine kinase [Planctomycetota bacterium]
MRDDQNKQSHSADLRKRALEILHNNPVTLAALPVEDIEHIAHELSVYQIELEMQNDEMLRVQNELERSRREYCDLYDFAPVGYLTVSPKGIIQKANLKAAAILGRERIHLVKHPFTKFILTEDMDICYLHRQKILDTKEMQECEIRVKKENGTILWAHLQCAPVINDNGLVTEIRSILTDITVRKQAQIDREKLSKSIQAKNEELQSIVYVSSHDLQSPLVNITGFGEELTTDTRKLQELMQEVVFDENRAQKVNTIINESIPESLRFINAGVESMKMLINGLLTISRVGTVKVNIGQIDMNDLLRRIVETFRFKIKESGAILTVDDLPGCRADEVLLNQVFSNLVGNALKYLAPERKGEIHISGYIEDNMSVYCVQDNGIGIDPKHVEKIFELFHRLNPHDAAGGEGLGLSIAMRILDRLDGSIRVESESGKESRFFVSLPKD